MTYYTIDTEDRLLGGTTGTWTVMLNSAIEETAEMVTTVYTIDTEDVLLGGTTEADTELFDSEIEETAEMVTTVYAVESEYPFYTGAYHVKPSQDEQTLHTAQKVMTGDVTVEEIPYYETTNESGGYTVIIG